MIIGNSMRGHDSIARVRLQHSTTGGQHVSYLAHTLRKYEDHQLSELSRILKWEACGQHPLSQPVSSNEYLKLLLPRNIHTGAVLSLSSTPPNGGMWRWEGGIMSIILWLACTSCRRWSLAQVRCLSLNITNHILGLTKEEIGWTEKIWYNES